MENCVVRAIIKVTNTLLNKYFSDKLRAFRNLLFQFQFFNEETWSANEFATVPPTMNIQIPNQP